MNSDLSRQQLAPDPASWPLFSSLRSDAVSAILGRATLLRVGEGTLLARQGDQADTLLFLNRGRVKLSRLSGEGRQTTLCIVQPGELIDRAAVFRNAVLPANAMALERCEVLGWARNALFALVETYPRLALNVLAVVGEQLDELARPGSRSPANTVPKRMAAELLRLAATANGTEGDTVELQMTRQDLGELVGATLFTVSRHLTAWGREGLVAGGRRRIVIRDRTGLARIAADLP